MPRSRTDGMRNSFRFIFRRDPAFVEILLPTLDQLEPFLKDRVLAYCILRVIILMDMNTPPPGLELHPAYRHSRMCPLSIKRFFIRHFGNLDLLSSAHHLDCPSRTSLCIPPQVACFGESFFDTRHTHSGSTLCRDSLSGKRDLRRC